MKNKVTSIRIMAIFSSLLMVLFPLSTVNADSVINAGITANVTQQMDNNITLNSITAVRTSGVADGTFENGWKWIFDITIPNTNETNLAMKFEDWLSIGFSNRTMPVANNIRFYSEQSANASNQATAIYITSANTYSSPMILTGNLNSSSQGTRRVRVTVENRIPTGTQTSSYSTNFSIKTTQ